jgi:hypothetical protein
VIRGPRLGDVKDIVCGNGFFVAVRKSDVLCCEWVVAIFELASVAIRNAVGSGK